MLAPEISDFTPPKVYVYKKEYQSIETVSEVIDMNNFYKSVVVTCPDEHSTSFIQNVIDDDSEYYKLSECPVIELTNLSFIEYYVKGGKINCMSVNTDCIVQNSVALTPDGILRLHILENMYKMLGLQGTKRPHGYYEVQIDLKELTDEYKMKRILAKLGVFDFCITWEPYNDKFCPSSMAKHFYDRGIKVTSHNMTFENVTATVKEIPGMVDVEVEDLVEWMGILAHKGDTSPEEPYISTYSEPKSLGPIYSNRISILIAKGFITPIILHKLTKTLESYVDSREPHNYWAAMSIQGYEESLWKFFTSSPRMFHSHITSTSIFFSRSNLATIYSTSQLKYS